MELLSTSKARRQEERDFASAFAHFSDLLVELSSCRKHVQEKIIARLTTNPTIAHSKQLYLTKVLQIFIFLSFMFLDVRKFFKIITFCSKTSV